MRSRRTGIITRRKRITMTANRRSTYPNRLVLVNENLTTKATKTVMSLWFSAGVVMVLLVAVLVQVILNEELSPIDFSSEVVTDFGVDLIGNQDEFAIKLERVFGSFLSSEMPLYTEEELAIAFEQERLLNFTAMQDKLVILLNGIVENEDGIIGISYLCLTTDRHITINGDYTFFAASTIKLSAHILAAEAVHEGLLSWDDLITITEYDMQGGADSGVLYDRGIGIYHEMTLYDLMRYSIIYSDNIGFTAVLRAVVPGAGHWGMDFTNAVYRRFMPQDYELAESRHRITPNHQMNILRELYEGLGVIAGYDIIIHYMKNIPHNFRFVTDLTRDYVAHIPGWTDPYNNDSGIFFTDFPYILVVYTRGVSNHEQFLSNIADLVFEMHHQFQ